MSHKISIAYYFGYTLRMSLIYFMAGGRIVMPVNLYLSWARARACVRVRLKSKLKL